MKLLIMVLNEVGLLEEILRELERDGIRGATIIDSMGMRKVLDTKSSNDMPIFGALKNMLSEGRPYNKTIFTVLSDEDSKKAVGAIRRVIGDLSRPNVGIVFTLPVDFVEGLIGM